MIYIGIDPGVKTGVAVYDKKQKSFIELRTMMLHDAFELVLQYNSMDLKVRVEDARKRTWFAKAEILDEKKEGAGSVKRDCKAWEDFLIAKGIPHEMLKPGKIKTKVHEKYFKQLTGWLLRCSVHARDAGMLVWGI